jgi:hypothetical protein
VLSVSSTALLNTLHNHFWHCHAIMIHTDCQFINLLDSRRRFQVFSTDGVSGIKNLKYVCFGFMCCACGPFSVSSRFFYWFLNCGLVQVLFLNLVLNF